MSDNSPVVDLAVMTLVVPATEIEELSLRYQELYGWTVVDDTPPGPDQLRSWGARLDGEYPTRMLVTPGENRGQVRLLGGSGQMPPPLATLGWIALEVTVADVDGLHEQLAAQPDVRINGAPADLVFSEGPPGQRAMQAVGPVGEQWYLTQILRQFEGRHLPVPPPREAVGCCFIGVLASSAYQETRRFWVEGLRMDPYIEVEGRLSVAAAENHWDESVRVPITALRGQGETRIELDGFPPGVPRRTPTPSQLPMGPAIATLAVEGLTEVEQRLARSGYRPLGPGTGEGARSITYLGADGERVELVEAT